MLPSVTDLYLSYVNDASLDEGPSCIMIGTDINVSPDPEDPSYIISFPAGVYFPIFDMGHGEVRYASKLILQQEHHIESIVHKIDDKFISGPMFIYAPFDSSLNLYVMDKTLGEIKEAINANVPMFFNIDNYQYPSKINFYLDSNAITCYVAEKQEISNNLMFSAYSFTADSDNDYPTAPPVIT